MNNYDNEQIIKVVLANVKLAAFIDSIKKTWELSKNNKKRFVEIVTQWVNRLKHDRFSIEELKKAIKTGTDNNFELRFKNGEFELIDLKDDQTSSK